MCDRNGTNALPDFHIIRRDFIEIYFKVSRKEPLEPFPPAMSFFFFTCQPLSGLKQLITEVHQQILTGHAQKHRADSEEDASSHHPLTDRFQVKAQTEIR